MIWAVSAVLGIFVLLVGAALLYVIARELLKRSRKTKRQEPQTHNVSEQRGKGATPPQGALTAAPAAQHELQVFESIASLARSSSRNPHIARGMELLEGGEVAKAIGHLEDAVKLDPKSWEAHYWLGNAYTSHRLWSAAIREYQATLRTNPDFLEAHRELATAYALTGRWAEAIPELQAALRLDPNSAEVHGLLGEIRAGWEGIAPESAGG